MVLEMVRHGRDKENGREGGVSREMWTHVSPADFPASETPLPTASTAPAAAPPAAATPVL